jgi:hypothetical protein
MLLSIFNFDLNVNKCPILPLFTVVKLKVFFKFIDADADSDPDPSFHFDADPDPSLLILRKAQNLEKVLT